MCASFKDAFSKKSVKIPPSVLNVLSETDLPKGFVYKEIKTGVLCVTSKDMKITISKDNLEIPSNLKNKTFDEILEYLYLTQTSLKIKGKVKINDEEFNLSQLVKMPFSDNKVIDGILELVPEPFKSFELKINCGNLSKVIKIKRQANENIKKSYFSTIDSDGLNMSYVIDNDKKTIDLKIDVDIDKCKDIKSTIENLKLVKGFYESNLKINDEILNLEKVDDKKYKYDIEVLSNTIEFYTKVDKISEILNIVIKPHKDISIKDLECVSKLYRTLIENKPYKEFVEIDKINLSAKNKIDDILRKDNYGSFQFSCNTELNLLDKNINLKTIIVIYNIQILNVEEICNQNKFDYELKVSNINNRRIYQSILYFKDEEAYSAYINQHKNVVEELATAEELNI